jgi:hypothetical protein
VSPPNGKDMTTSNNSQLFDGRQSPVAVELARGCRRLLLAHGLATLPEVTLASGRRADLIGLSDRGDIWIVEIKSSIVDFKCDQKWPEYREFCDRLFFAVAPSFPQDLLPDDVGIVVADRFGGELVRDAPCHPIAPARRKALTARLARVGAMRLLALADPELALGRGLGQEWNL